MKKYCVAAVMSVSLLAAGVALACSNVAVQKGNYSITARTMDFPFNTGNKMGFGGVGEKNISDLNMSPQAAQAHAIHWRNRYNFEGQTWLRKRNIVDGINDQGVYAAYLYLPDFTQYPVYAPQDNDKKLLGEADVVNYVLGTAKNVQQAVNELKQVKIVGSANETNIQKDGMHLFMAAPTHVIIRDRSGDAAVIEWIHGKTVIHNHAGPVLTNSPPYDWQVKNAQRYDYVSVHNIDSKYDGAYMNGSGFTGIPGDFSPPSRFARATQIIKHLPMPQNNNEAVRETLSALESVQVPLGANDSPSFWKTVADLQHNIYYYYQMYKLTPEYSTFGGKDVKVSSPLLNEAWQVYDLNKVASDKQMQANMVSTQIMPTPHHVIKLLNVVNQATPGPETKLKACKTIMQTMKAS